MPAPGGSIPHPPHAAPDESPHVLPPIHRKILAFSFIGWVFDFYDLLLLSFLISTTSITKDLNLTTYEMSVLLGTALPFTAVGGMIGGALANPHRPASASRSRDSDLVSLARSAASPRDMGWYVARAVTGIGVGGEWAVAHALVGETVPPHVRGRYGSYLQSGAASRLRSRLAGQLRRAVIGWRLDFIVSALPALMVVFIRSQMPESDVWLLHKKAGRATSSLWRVIAEMVSPALRKTTGLAMTVTTSTSSNWRCLCTSTRQRIAPRRRSDTPKARPKRWLNSENRVVFLIDLKEDPVDGAEDLSPYVPSLIERIKALEPRRSS